MIKRLVMASNNSAKTREIQSVFKVFGMPVVNYRELIDTKQFPAETTLDQYANALGKAQFIQQFLPNENILADDTGAYFEAFPDRFGLTTARELKTLGLASIREENEYLLNLYTPTMDRHAYLEALLVLVTPTGDVISSTGRGGVALARSERGDYSIGFDRLFEAENGKTFAEMLMPERIIYSHRGRAAKKILQELKHDD